MVIYLIRTYLNLFFCESPYYMILVSWYFIDMRESVIVILYQIFNLFSSLQQ
jgi:hypothetical protein